MWFSAIAIGKISSIIGITLLAIAALRVWRFLLYAERSKIETFDAERSLQITLRVAILGIVFQSVGSITGLFRDSLLGDVSIVALSLVLSIVLIAVIWRVIIWKIRRGEKKASQMFPILNKLEPGQCIVVELKNGKILSDVAFVMVFYSKITLASDPKFDETQGIFIYHKVLDVKLKKIRSISLNTDRSRLTETLVQ